jgi:hypothetical protein
MRRILAAKPIGFAKPIPVSISIHSGLWGAEVPLAQL